MTFVKLYLYTLRGPVLQEQRSFHDYSDAYKFEKQRGQELADLHQCSVSGAAFCDNSPLNICNAGYYQPRA